MTPSLQEYLPEESFVPFVAKRLAAPTLLWQNARITTPRAPLAYAYCMSYPEEPALAYLDEEKLFLGERYGGPGLGGNSGGVRCGLDGVVQIKGIGQNPLAGTSTDFWHRHGAASLQECIKESIWGEVLQLALPFGAVRAYAIIATNTHFTAEIADTKQARAVPRALLLRQAALRPAHFMRSIFAAPSPALAPFCTDVERTRKACQAVACLGAYLDNPGDSADSPLLEVFRRAAWQIAASRAKRIIHGSLIASNFAVDGKWLDFGTVTTLADYGRAVVAPGSLDLWRQPISVLDTIDDLFFYMGKYAPAELRSALPDVEQVKTDFLYALRQRMEIEFLKLTGIPEHCLPEVPGADKNRLVGLMLHLLSSGNHAQYLYYGDDRHAMPTRTGHYALTAVMRTCALSRNREQLCRELSAELPAKLAHEVADSYWCLKDELLARVPGSEVAQAGLALSIRGLRANWDLSALYRRRIDGAIDDLTAEPDAVGAFIDAQVAYWSGLLDDRQLAIPLDPWLTSTPSTLSSDLRLQAHGRALASGELPGLIHGFHIAPAEKQSLIGALHALSPVS